MMSEILIFILGACVGVSVFVVAATLWLIVITGGEE